MLDDDNDDFHAQPPEPDRVRHPLSEALGEALAGYYGRLTEGAAPPVDTTYLWGPHRRYLAQYYPQPMPPGGRMGPIPTFTEWLVREGVPLPPGWRGPTSPPAPDPADPVQLALLGLSPEE